MGNRRRATRAQELVAQLNNPDFQSAVKAFRKPTFSSGTPDEVRKANEPGGALEQAQQRAVETFKVKWGVTPPDALLLDKRAPRSEAQAVLGGRFGTIVVYPWTTGEQVTRSFKRQRAAIQKGLQFDEDDRITALAEWCIENGCKAADVAAAVLGRKTGLKRPTRSEVNRRRRLLDKVDRRLKDRHEAGMPRDEREAYAFVQGKEPPAAAAARMRVGRYRKKMASYKWRTPSDPFVAALRDMLMVYALVGPEAAGPFAPQLAQLHRALVPPPPA